MAIPTLGFVQDFEVNEDGVIADGVNYGAISTLTSDTGGIITADGGDYALVTEVGSGPFTRFDGYRSEFVDGLTASVDVYLDIDWATGEGFDYSVAANGTNGTHLRDFVFHVTKDTSTGQLLVGASTGSNFVPVENLESGAHGQVAVTGWYTLQQVFRDAGGTLAVDFNLIDANGTVVWNTTLATADPIPAQVGGNRYGWFTDVTVTGGLAIDKLMLGEFAGSVNEIADKAAGEGLTDLTVHGVIPFMDLDVLDSHTIIVEGGAGYVGTLDAVVSDSTGTGEGRVTWTFNVADSAVDHLDAGKTLNQTYTVTIDDGNGGLASRDITVTINGAADIPGNTVAGTAGRDTLVGTDGNDVIDGGRGPDTMSGGLGNDTYYVDNRRDVILENPNGGSDTVTTSVSYTLGANQENLTLVGLHRISGFGNELDNVILGNEANNTLNGFGGMDRLTGGLGADTFAFSVEQDTSFGMFDVVTDFNAEQRDRIDLRGIDARSDTGGNQKFVFIGTAEFSDTSAAGQLRFDTGSHMLLGSTDADANAEIAIELVGVNSLEAESIRL